MSTDVERLVVMSGAGAPCTCHQLRWQRVAFGGTLGLPGDPDGFLLGIITVPGN
jgi:hypothetical protein